MSNDNKISVMSQEMWSEHRAEAARDQAKKLAEVEAQYERWHKEVVPLKEVQAEIKNSGRVNCADNKRILKLLDQIDVAVNKQGRLADLDAIDTLVRYVNFLKSVRDYGKDMDKWQLLDAVTDKEKQS